MSRPAWTGSYKFEVLTARPSRLITWDDIGTRCKAQVKGKLGHVVQTFTVTLNFLILSWLQSVIYRRNKRTNDNNIYFAFANSSWIPLDAHATAWYSIRKFIWNSIQFGSENCERAVYTTDDRRPFFVLIPIHWWKWVKNSFKSQRADCRTVNTVKMTLYLHWMGWHRLVSSHFGAIPSLHITY